MPDNEWYPVYNTTTKDVEGVCPFTDPGSFDPGTDVYVEQMIDWAANLGPSIALVETSSSVTNSVIQALNELDRKFDFYDTSDFSGIDFSGYGAVIVAMDGGTIEEPSIQNVANFASSGGNLIMLGGSSWANFAPAVDAHLLDIDTTSYGWSLVTGSPHLDVSNSNHPLTDGLPDTYDFVTSSATYYMIRSQDTDPASHPFSPSSETAYLCCHHPAADAAVGKQCLSTSVPAPPHKPRTGEGD